MQNLTSDLKNQLQFVARMITGEGALGFLPKALRTQFAVRALRQIVVEIDRIRETKSEDVTCTRGQ